MRIDIQKYPVLITAFLSIILLSSPAYSQNLRMNEVMTANANVIPDEDGDFSDWIEIYNGGPGPLSLNGLGLTDDVTDPFKWTFPNIVLTADRHLLIFASDKDRTDIPAHWETVIDWGNHWRYGLGHNEPPADWAALDYNDQLWPSGPSGFGYGDDDDATVIQPVISLYLRHRFSLENVADITHMLFHVDYDDAFVAYLNDVEMVRANIGPPGIRPPHDQIADDNHEARMYSDGLPDAFNVSHMRPYLQNGENVLAIQVHNYGPNSSDMTMIPFLTLGRNTVPANANGCNPLLAGMLPRLHTNFKLSSSGETLRLSHSDGSLLDEIETGGIPANISRGRFPDGSSDWHFYNEPTPGATNGEPGMPDFAPTPDFSPPGGLFPYSVTLSLSGNSSGETIYYTLDGSDPTESAPVYTGPITLTETTVVRARMMAPETIPSVVVTNSYIIGPPPNLPVISLSTDPANLWDWETGIYAMGPNADANFPYFGANFWQDWERPIHLELFETDQTPVINMPVGVKIFGGWSRGYPQKSLSLFARSQYGPGEIDYPIFPDKPITEFESIVLRNSGNDWDFTMFRDGLMTGLVRGLDLDLQAYRPAVIYLNGEYWGILNIREKVNEHFIAANNLGVDENNLDLLEGPGWPIHGDSEHYTNMIDYITTHNLAVPENYEYVQTLLDVDNFINYQIAQIYFDNRDWPGNNIKYWRERSPAGKWRWIIYDTDFGFGIWNPYAYTENTLEFALEPNGPDWPNPPWSTLILRRLLDNDHFRNEFINRFADHLNTIFSPETINTQIDTIESNIASEMVNHRSRWGGTINQWAQQVTVLRNFANNRHTFQRVHLINHFDLEYVAPVALSVNLPNSGKIRLNSLILSDFPWTGHYFHGVPVSLTAYPQPGYRFVRWEGSLTATEPSITLLPESTNNLTAVFEIDDNPSSTLVINEINYNSTDTFNPEDWVEFYNNSANEVNLGNWIFQDEEDEHAFVFPENTIVAPGALIVVCREAVNFNAFFPEVTNIAGQMDFGLSGGGESIRLYDAAGTLVDSLTYDDAPPWPVEADGHGPTLALINPDLDNALPASWQAANAYGTPGAPNNVVVRIENEAGLRYQATLSQNYPNPCRLSASTTNPATTIEYTIAANGRVTLKIYNVAGQLVRVLLDTDLSPGAYLAAWDGRTVRGEMAGAGVYLYRLQVNDRTVAQKRLVVLP